MKKESKEALLKALLTFLASLIGALSGAQAAVLVHHTLIQA